MNTEVCLQLYSNDDIPLFKFAASICVLVQSVLDNVTCANYCTRCWLLNLAGNLVHSILFHL